MSQKSTMIPKRIAQIRFGLMDPIEIRKMSAVEVKTADTYKDDGHAYRQGLMDPHMGVIEPGLVCPTDNCKYDESPGHFGHIQLELPVMHIGFVNLIKTALKATCSKCSNILLHKENGSHPSNPELSEQDYFRTRIRDIIVKHGVGSTEFAKIIKEVEKVTTGTSRGVCMHCGEAQGKIALDKPTTFKEKKEAKGQSGKDEGWRKLNPRDVREWLSGIPSDDLIFIGMDKQNRPEWIVLKVLPVPPITVRPSITLDSGDRSEDDLTHKLVDVLRINQRLRENRDSGAPQLIVEDLWELLQYHVTTYFDNQTSGIPPARHRSGRTLKTLTQRLKGKEGRFRSNLSGKRVNFCARSVISPDPYLGVNEVGVPTKIAKELTVPIRVTSRNREQMRQMILRGPDVHPGVNYIIRGDGRRVRINQRSRLITLDSDATTLSATMKRPLVSTSTPCFLHQTSYLVWSSSHKSASPPMERQKRPTSLTTTQPLLTSEAKTNMVTASLRMTHGQSSTTAGCGIWHKPTRLTQNRFQSTSRSPALTVAALQMNGATEHGSKIACPPLTATVTRSQVCSSSDT